MLATFCLTTVSPAEAQQTKVYRVGVILHGGPYYDAINGLRDGLKELRLTEGKHYVLEIRDAKGDLKAVEEAASLEREKVDLIFAVATSVTIAVKRVTANLPIVFYAGSDPVALGLVESFANPGGRLTGVHNQTTDLTAKRLEILKEMLPKARRILTFYNPSNRSAAESAKVGREASGQMGLELVERHVASVEELQGALGALKAREMDAYLLLSDGMVISQAQLIIDTARAKRMATMFHEGNLVANGGLASYGISYQRAGHVSAKYIQRISTGTLPKDLPVETVDKLDLVFNLATAKQIGVTIPPNVLARADRVIR
ncbi:MAG: ABC transporter substrate-binding protein [Deltaproteobacteria bacterium]|nr:MAG: ABC transporter substrate-binding protein [Deltaproteobacteria bacterium]